MVFACKLCEKETVIMTHLCDKCRRIKHLINLYDDRVYEVLENCLVRTEQQIQNKEHLILKHESNKLANSVADLKALKAK